MRTLRAFFHMGSVEWVTCQVPERKDRGGGRRGGADDVEEACEMAVEGVPEADGVRRVMGDILRGKDLWIRC
jgi:hypothetical protein